MIAIGMAAVAILLAASTAQAASVGEAVRVSPVGHTVAEFSAATSPTTPQLMVASAIDEDLPGDTRCAVYLSSDGGGSWSEVPAWPRSPLLEPVYDPWVAIGGDGTIHTTCIAGTNFGARVVYAQSRDQGVSWTSPRAVTPLPAQFHRQSADKSALTVAADGTIYVCFNQVLTTPLGPRGLIAARSTDDGLSWTTRDTGVRDAFCNGIVTTPAGTVTSAFISTLGYGTVTSADGGDSWGAPVTLGEFNAFNLPSIVHDATGRTVIGEVAGATTPSLEISIENAQGALVQQWQLPRPASTTCENGRMIQPALTAPPTGLPAFQIACKIDPTRTTVGRQEVWVYPSIDQPATTPQPVQTTGFDLPASGSSTGPTSSFAKRFPDGGDYWSLTWRSGGLLSMWVDPRTGGGPGELWSVPVSP